MGYQADSPFASVVVALQSALLVATALLPSSAVAQQPQPSPKLEVKYGRVDAATVRVFSVGNVGTADYTLRGQRIKVARPDAGHGSGFVTGVNGVNGVIV
ncbi:MAG: hypothetical protein V2A73_01165, partial [Pseudomonadota bacterium]